MEDIELGELEITEILARHFTLIFGEKATVQLVNGRAGEHLGLVKFTDAKNTPSG
jgi:hypothetical protein